MHAPHAILLLGPTASGKTPFGDLLERNGLWATRCVHFDFGRQLRHVAAAPGPSHSLTPREADIVRSALRAGALLEDHQFPIATKLLQAFLADRAVGAHDILVLNGLPRHIGQATAMDNMVHIVAIVELSCSPDAVLARIRTNAGGDRIGRIDDDTEAVRHKLALYAERTTPLCHHYRHLGVPVRSLPVDARTTPDELWHAIECVPVAPFARKEAPRHAPT